MKNKFSEWFRQKRESLFSGLLLALLCCAAFLPALNFEILPFDDSIYIGNTYLLRFSFANFVHHLTTPVLALHSPLVMYSLSFDQLLWGAELIRIGARLHNLLLHIISVILLYHICRELHFTRRDGDTLRPGLWAALAAAAAFALHPQRVESVIWIAERKDCLVLALGLGALYTFLKAERENRISILSVVLFILSFGAKPLMFLLPLILLAAMIAEDRELQWKRWTKMIWPYFAWSALYLLLNLRQLGEFSSEAVRGTVAGSRMEVALANFGYYFFRTFFPLDLSPLYPLYEAGSGKWVILAFALMCAAVLLFSFHPSRFRTAFCYGWLVLLLAYGIAVAPMVGFKAIGNADFADRYSYFPSVFIWIGFAFLLQYLSESCRQLKNIALILLPLLCAVLLWNTWSYLPIWKSGKAFFDRIIAEEHPNPTAIPPAVSCTLERREWDVALGLAQLYRSQYGAMAPGGQRGAENFFLVTCGIIAYRTGSPEAALAYFDKALSSPVWGCLLFQSYDLAKSVLLTAANEHLKRSKNPDDRQKAINLYGMASNMLMDYDPAAAWSARGTSLMLAGNLAGAEKAMATAYQLDPEDVRKAHNLRQIRKMRLKKAQLP